jgi:hypothetical protein
MQSQRRHVLAEHDFVVRLRIDEIGNRLMSTLDQLIDHLRGAKMSLDVRVRTDKAITHAVDHAL